MMKKRKNEVGIGWHRGWHRLAYNFSIYNKKNDKKHEKQPKISINYKSANLCQPKTLLKE